MPSSTYFPPLSVHSCHAAGSAPGGPEVDEDYFALVDFGELSHHVLAGDAGGEGLDNGIDRFLCHLLVLHGGCGFGLGRLLGAAGGEEGCGERKEED